MTAFPKSILTILTMTTLTTLFIKSVAKIWLFKNYLLILPRNYEKKESL